MNWPARTSAARVFVEHASPETDGPNRAESGRQRKGHSLSRDGHRDGLPQESEALQGNGVHPGGETGSG